MALTAGPRTPGRVLMALGVLALLAGLWAGLIRIGWTWPAGQPELLLAHGPLMVNGFLGLVIGLERAVALGRRWAFAAPALSALGALECLSGLPLVYGAALFAGSSLMLVAIFALIYRLRPEAASGLLIAGAVAWLVGNTIWMLGRPIPPVTPWWAGFLILTIAGERLELAQVLLPTRDRLLLLGTAAIVLVGLGVSLLAYTGGVRIAGAGLVAMAAWLVRSDGAQRRLRRGGVTRFASLALLLGYVWLAVAGVLWLLGPASVPGLWYDAMLHSVFLGFAFSMIFGHAPTILPAVAGISLPFEGLFYLPLALLHASLVLRIVGDLLPSPVAREWGGLLNATAIVLFGFFIVYTARQHRTPRLAPRIARSG